MYQRLILGDSYSFTTTVPDYPATDGWTLAHVLRPRSSGDAIEIEADADGSSYLTTIPTTITTDWDAGQYSVIAQVAKSGARHTLDAVALAEGRLTSDLITILPDPLEGEAVDTRSHARKTLDALNAMIEGRASRPEKEFTIRDRSVGFMEPQELITWRRYYVSLVANEVAAARRAQGLPDPRRSYVRFVRR